MSQICSDTLNKEITADLTARLNKFSAKWQESVKSQKLTLMLSTLKSSAIVQISSHVNEALTAHKAGKSFVDFQKKFKTLQTPEFLSHLGIQGKTLEKSRFQGEVREEALQLLEDFSVFVGGKASAYFSELAPHQATVETNTCSVVVKTIPAVTIPKKVISKRAPDLEKLHRSSLLKLEKMTQTDMAKIDRAIKGANNSLFLKAYYKQSVLPLYMALSWDIRQKKARGEVIFERDIKLKKELENACDVCIQKLNEFQKSKVAPKASFCTVSTATAPQIQIPVKSVAANVTNEEAPDSAAQSKMPPTKNPEKFKNMGKSITGRAVAVGMLLASAATIVALSSSGFWGGSVAAERTASFKPDHVSHHSVSTQFNAVADDMTSQQNIARLAAMDIPEPQISIVATPVHKIHKTHKIRTNFVKSSNDNYVREPAKIGDFQMKRTTQETLNNMCRIHANPPAWLCANS